MLDCLILGDSLAVGVGQIRTECITYAKTGINSKDFLNRFVSNTRMNPKAKTVIISLGSNDSANLNTFKQLDMLRQRIEADRVFWIVPAIKKDKQEIVWAVANKYRDGVVNSRNHDIGPDGVHPTQRGYKTIAKQTRDK